MSETKEEIAAERDALRLEVDKLSADRDRLTGELAAAASTGRATAPVHTFQLSQGQLAELEASGVTVIDGVLRTTAEVRKMLGEDQKDVTINEPPKAITVPKRVERTAVRGVDFVYPSVAPGQIDPAVAGQPGISGPATVRK